MIFVVVLIACVLFTLNLFTLVALRSVVQDQKANWEAFVFVTDRTLEKLFELEDKIDNALDCLLRTDVQLDALTNPEESGTNAQ
jgi:hypothetical protein